MRENALRLGASLVALSGFLLLCTMTSAETNAIQVTGEIVQFERISGESVRSWDGSGDLHVRNQRQNMLLEGEIEGRLLVFEDMTQDGVTGEAKCHGKIAFIGSILGDEYRASGSSDGGCSEVLGEEICVFQYTLNLHHGEQIQLLVVRPRGADLPWAYSGVLKEPMGHMD